MFTRTHSSPPCQSLQMVVKTSGPIHQSCVHTEVCVMSAYEHSHATYGIYQLVLCLEMFVNSRNYSMHTYTQNLFAQVLWNLLVLQDLHLMGQRNIWRIGTSQVPLRYYIQSHGSSQCHFSDTKLWFVVQTSGDEVNG